MELLLCVRLREMSWLCMDILLKRSDYASPIFKRFRLKTTCLIFIKSNMFTTLNIRSNIIIIRTRILIGRIFLRNK